MMIGFFSIAFQQDVSTEICQQLISWLSGFRHTYTVTKHMNWWTFLFVMFWKITIMMLRNNQSGKKLQSEQLKFFTKK